MSVLERLRSGSDSTLMQVVFLLVILSFIGWGAQSGSSGGAATVVEVNGQAITSRELGEALRNAEYRQGRRGMTEEQRAELRERVTEQLIRQTIALQEASRLGLVVSAAEIGDTVMRVFPEVAAQADRASRAKEYEKQLRARGLSRAAFEADLGDQILVEKLTDLLMLGASISKPAILQTWIEDQTKVDIEFVRVRPAAFASSIELSDADVTAWADAHKDLVQQRYDRDFTAKYDLPERIDVRVIRLLLQEDGLGLADLKTRLEAVRAKAEAGEDFATLARTWSEDASAAAGGLDEGIAPTQLPAEFSEALRTLEPGALSPVVVGVSDVRLYKLEKRDAARKIPLDEVRLDVARELMREEQAPAKAKAFAEETVLARWKADGKAPTDALDPVGLRVDSTGLVAVGDGGGLVSPPDELLDAARTAALGSVLPQVYTDDDGVLWVAAIAQREDADAAAFAKDEAVISEQLLMRRRADFFEAWLDDLVARAKISR